MNDCINVIINGLGVSVSVPWWQGYCAVEFLKSPQKLMEA